MFVVIYTSIKQYVLSYNKYVSQKSSTQIKLHNLIKWSENSVPSGNISLQCGNANCVNTTYWIFTYL